MERLPEFIANHLFLCSLLMALIMLLLWNLLGDTLSGVKSVSPREATQMMNRDDALVIDVRAESDYLAGHILNAENYPAKELEQYKDKLAPYKDKTLIVYCQHGQESAQVTRTMKQLGFSNAHTIKGGMTAWTSANLPTLSGKA